MSVVVNKGGKLICVNAKRAEHLTEGKPYTVTRDLGTINVRVKDDANTDRQYALNRFENADAEGKLLQ